MQTSEVAGVRLSSMVIREGLRIWPTSPHCKKPVEVLWQSDWDALWRVRSFKHERRRQCRTRTCWRNYISRLAWKPSDELEEVSLGEECLDCCLVTDPDKQSKIDGWTSLRPHAGLFTQVCLWYYVNEGCFNQCGLAWEQLSLAKMQHHGNTWDSWHCANHEFFYQK